MSTGQELEVVDSVAFNSIMEVAELRMLGTSEYMVARKLGIPMRVVKERYDMYHDILTRDHDARDMAKDYLNTMVVHFDKLISESYELLDDLKALDFNEKIAAQINTTLKNISEYEDKRLKALREAGLMDGREMGDQIAEMERKQAILIDILRNDLCPADQVVVKRRLQEVTGTVEVLVVNEDV